MPNNLRGTRTDPMHRYTNCQWCGARFQLSRRGQPGGALGTSARLTGMVNDHEKKCHRRPKMLDKRIESIAHEIRAKIEEIKADSRFKQPTATVVENAPLALIQLAMESKLQALKWVLGEQESLTP